MNFGFLLYPRLEELDLIGPWEMITTWGQVADGPRDCFTVAETDAEIRCAKGLRILPDYRFEACPRLDYLLVPGGIGTRTEVDNASLVYFVATQARSCKAVASVCAGTFILHAAGLLQGRRATTHWASLDRLRQLPDVTVIEERYVQDDNVWTSAGISAGIDMALALIADQAGDEAAAKVQLATEYYPARSVYGSPSKHPLMPAYMR